MLCWSERPRPVVLDGGLASELQRRGQHVRAPQWTNEPLFTNNGRDLLRSIHTEYVDAGADVITANTFRTGLRALRRIGLDERDSARLTTLAVQEARSAAGSKRGRRPLVAGSVAPVEDCYRPDLVPSDKELVAEHRWLARQLSGAGVDFILAETMNSLKEARIVIESARGADLSVVVSFVCTSGARILSGEQLKVAAQEAQDIGAEAVLVNCTSPSDTEEAIAVLRDHCRIPIGAYPNLEDRSTIADWTPVDRHVPSVWSAEEFASMAATWLHTYRLSVIGACCGSAPEHIAALVRLVHTAYPDHSGQSRS